MYIDAHTKPRLSGLLAREHDRHHAKVENHVHWGLICFELVPTPESGLDEGGSEGWNEVQRR